MATYPNPPAHLPKVRLTENSKTILQKRYLQQDETPEQRFWAVAQHVAGAERNFGGGEEVVEMMAARFYERMAKMEFLPNSPTIRNAGTAFGGTLSACFVIPVEDSMEGIMEGRRQAAFIMKYGGGVGFNFSRLRPRDTKIKSTNKGACGPVAVMRDYNMLSETFTQGVGAFRKGAQMHMLNVDHPDIREFIHCKDGGGDVLNANISVCITDKFLLALDGQSPHRNGYTQYALDGGMQEAKPLIDPLYAFPLQWGGTVYAWVDARELWEEITESAWTTGDPGLAFLDRVNRTNPAPHLFTIESSNPCGEQFLEPYGSCNLGSIALDRFVISEPNAYWQDGSRVKGFDFDGFKKCVTDCVRFLDNVVEVNEMPTAETAAANKLTRRIGLGLMGWAAFLAEMKVPYASDEAMRWADLILTEFRDAADKASLDLAYFRGTYPGWEGSEHETQGLKYRNLARTTMAPTGTIAGIAGTSWGLEPYFALENDREMADGTILKEYVPAFKEWTTTHMASEPLPDYFQTAMDIPIEWHMRHQAKFQQYIDNSISKTINLPHDATVEDVRHVYRQAVELGCKGVTIYRDGSRDKQVLTTITAPTLAEESVTTEKLSMKIEPVFATQKPTRRRMDDVRDAITHKFTVDGHEGYLTVGLYEDGTPGEMFLRVSKSGSTVSGLVDALAMVWSIALQYGVPLAAFTDKLRDIRFEPAGRTSNADMPLATSIVDYVARWMANRFGDDGLVRVTGWLEQMPMTAHGLVSDKKPSGQLCPECGGIMYSAEGCLNCNTCGFSKCG